jgi:hypothetical protein
MLTIYSSAKDETGKPYISVYNPNADAKIGRWCRAPQVPDRCDNCWDSETLVHYPAEAYREKIDPNDETVWRFGTCHRCEPNLIARGVQICT